MSPMPSTAMLRHVSACAIGAFFLLCCESGSSASPPVSPPTGPVVASVTLSPSPTRLIVGDSTALQWVARDKNGAMLDVSVTFTSSPSGIVNVSSSGQVAAVGAGNVTITVHAGDVTASNSIQVLPFETVADVKVLPMALDVGQNVPLTFAVYNPHGVLLTGKTATFTPASPGVVSISSAGVVKGVGYGTTTVQLTVDTVVRTTNVRVATWPQEPDGFTKVTERDFSRLATFSQDTTGLDGWDAGEESQWKNIAIVNDPTAPRSPPSVLQATYPAGTLGGSSAATPGRITRGIPGSPTWVYFSVWVQLSANWFAHPTGTNKVLYVWINNQPRFFLSAEGSNANALSPAGRLQGTPDDQLRGREALMPNVHAQRVVPGTWQRWEVVLKVNTPGFSDGEFHLWIDGMETTNYTNVAYLDSKDTISWMEMDIEPIWGGQGSSVPATQTMRFDHIYVSSRK